MKNKKTTFILYILIAIILAFGIITISNLTIKGIKKTADFISNPLGEWELTKVTYAKEVEPTMKEWIRNEIEQAGLKWEDVNCLITNESNWDVWATNWNTNGTVDYGLWMINSIHKDTISVKDRYDYKTATKWAINKILRDGNYNAWYAFNKKCKI